jgi:hypothetical protein
MRAALRRAQKTPRHLVDKHAQLVHSCDDYDNVDFPYSDSGKVYIFSCRKVRRERAKRSHFAGRAPSCLPVIHRS